MEHVIEKNRMIAEFMGFVFYDDEGKYYHIEEGYFLCRPKKLKYHKDWNWIMPVIKKIRGIINAELSIDQYFGQQDHFNFDIFNMELEQTFEMAVQFIEWYDNNQPETIN